MRLFIIDSKSKFLSYVYKSTKIRIGYHYQHICATEYIRIVNSCVFLWWIIRVYCVQGMWVQGSKQLNAIVAKNGNTEHAKPVSTIHVIVYYNISNKWKVILIFYSVSVAKLTFFIFAYYFIITIYLDF